MGVIDLAVQCRKCGQWGGMSTNQLKKAIYKCKVCEAPATPLFNTKGVRNMYLDFPSEGQLVSELVKKNNAKEVKETQTVLTFNTYGRR